MKRGGGGSTGASTSGGSSGGEESSTEAAALRDLLLLTETSTEGSEQCVLGQAEKHATRFVSFFVLIYIYLLWF
jgi:hypothetical protein